MLDIRGVSAGYGNVPVIRDINLHMRQGEIYCFIGPNGSGKSTLLGCIAGQIRLLAGNIYLQGEAISGIPAKEYAKKVAYLRQIRDMPVISVENLVLYGRYPYLRFPRKLTDHDRELAKSAMIKTGIWELRHKMLNGLSGGECQKAYIAMALAQDTGVLLLDEPAAFLDICSQLELMALICQLRNEGKTIIMALHDIAEAVRMADTICLLSRGEIAFAGAPADLLESRRIDDVYGVTVSSAVVGGTRRLFFDTVR